MVTLAASFRTESQRIHNEHQAVEQLLAKLDAGLDRLVCYSEVYANLATAREVATLGRQLVGEFSDHCQREEASQGPVGGLTGMKLREEDLLAGSDMHLPCAAAQGELLDHLRNGRSRPIRRAAGEDRGS